MDSRRHGSKVKLPSTTAIKHQLLTMMIGDELRALPPGEHLNEQTSPALTMLRRLKGTPTTPSRSG